MNYPEPPLPDQQQPMLADPLSSYVSGATIAVTGGRPFL